MLILYLHFNKQILQQLARNNFNFGLDFLMMRIYWFLMAYSFRHKKALHQTGLLSLTLKVIVRISFQS
ncbi:hypothetical protein C0W40_04030 [Photobacterium leiognathi subsp. mandapamensis]|nr:hypothetical protein C0W40_04030 [Photobacterium leiognathi subsp. mandapamensis]